MSIFRFKQFTVDDSRCGMKIGTDGVLLGSWAHADGAGCIIDAGTGSGLIALMMAQRYPKTHVTGIDIDEPATLDAMHNVSMSPWSGRIDIINTDLLNWSPRQSYTGDRTSHMHSVQSAVLHRGSSFPRYRPLTCPPRHRIWSGNIDTMGSWNHDPTWRHTLFHIPYGPGR